MSSFKYGFSIIQALKSQGSNNALDTNSLYIADYDMPELHIFSTFHKAKKYLQENHNPSQTNQFRFVMPAGIIDAAKAGKEIDSEADKIILPRWTRLECNDATYITAIVGTEANLSDLQTYGIYAFSLCCIYGGQIEHIDGNLQNLIAVFNSVIHKITMNEGALYLSDCILNVDSQTNITNPTLVVIKGIVQSSSVSYPQITIDNRILQFTVNSSNLKARINAYGGKITLYNSFLRLMPNDNTNSLLEIDFDITLESSNLSISDNIIATEINSEINGKNGFVVTTGTIDIYGQIINDVSLTGGTVNIQDGAEVTLTEQNCNVVLFSGSKLNSPISRNITLIVDGVLKEKRKIELDALIGKGTPTRVIEAKVFNQSKNSFVPVINVNGVVVSIDRLTVIDEGDELIIWFK